MSKNTAILEAIQKTYQKYEGWSLSATEVLLYLVEQYAELSDLDYHETAANCLVKDLEAGDSE